MIDSDFVTEIRRLAEESVSIETIELNDAEYTRASQPLVQVPIPRLAEPSALVISKLSGLVDYVNANRDVLKLDEAILHVVSPAEVRLQSKLTGDSQQRFSFVTAKLNDRLSGFVFGQWQRTEDLVIALLTRFEPRGHRADVLRILGTIKAEGIKTSQDDGFTQKVAASAGVVLDVVSVPNPVDLAPFRTFVEVEQPESKFAFRVKLHNDAEVLATLFEADGGAWRDEAVSRIAAYLRANVGDKVAVIA